MTSNDERVFLTGYSDRLSVRPGETIAFKTSCAEPGECKSWLTRLISGDPNPAGMGVIELSADEWYEPKFFDAADQLFHPGSFAQSFRPVSVSENSTLKAKASVFLTLEKSSDQIILSLRDLWLGVDVDGCCFAQLSGTRIKLDQKLSLRRWCTLALTVNLASGQLELSQISSDAVSCKAEGKANRKKGDLSGLFCVAARLHDEIAIDCFNGKIEAPSLDVIGKLGKPANLICWDFSKEINSTHIVDTTSNGNHGTLINFPTRAVTGASWSGKEMCWRHSPDEYAAIHFHEDDIYDFGWDTSFEYRVPDDMPSGVYVMHIARGGNSGHEDSMPFCVCPVKGKPTADVCVVIPTFTYIVYGNHARPDFEESWLDKSREWGAYPNNPASYKQYGLSTYNFHTDGSGIAHASHLRPLFNLRPGYVTFGGANKDSGLRHLQADTHLISWLHDRGIEYDIITDHEIHAEGSSVLNDYPLVLTTTHPEYHTYETLNSIQQYTKSGGNLAYLGGNGFYWRVALHPEHAGIIEIRRAEDGIRAWAAEPGEYYSAFDGLYGGLWRRIGRPPQELVGIGFTAQGNFTGSYYKRKCYDAEYDWVFDGIDSDVIGDFGFSGGGAAGFELDRVDEKLGTPENTVVLASSEGHNEHFVLVPEEHLTHITNIPGRPTQELLRADMVYFTLPGGGSVFSVGSITFCGSLPVNGFDNSVSRLLENLVVRKTER